MSFFLPAVCCLIIPGGAFNITGVTTASKYICREEGDEEVKLMSGYILSGRSEVKNS